MSSLAASVRLSMWVTAAWAGHLDLRDAVTHALPDLDVVQGGYDQLALWQDLGERLLVCALPSPGALEGLPRGSSEFVGAALEAGECVYVPSIGGALVPEFDTFGPIGDEGERVTLTSYDCDPTPSHVLAAIDESSLERQFRSQLLSATTVLESLEVQPWAGSSMRAVAEDRGVLREWGLPLGIPGRAARLIQLAGTVSAATDVALETSPAIDAASHTSRDRELRQLQAAADTALAGAANAAALSLSGMRAGR